MLFFLLRGVEQCDRQREKEVITFWWTHFCFINKTSYRSTLYRSTSLIFQSRCLGRCKGKKWIFCDNEVTWLRLILLLRKRQSEKLDLSWLWSISISFHFFSFGSYNVACEKKIEKIQHPYGLSSFHRLITILFFDLCVRKQYWNRKLFEFFFSRVLATFCVRKS